MFYVTPPGIFKHQMAMTFGFACVGTIVFKYLRRRKQEWVYKSQMVGGVPMPPFQTEERHKKVCEFLASDHPAALNEETDVWIATYPKCKCSLLKYSNTCKYSYVPSSIPSALVPDLYILLGGTTWMQQLCVELTRIDLLSGTTDGKEPAKLSVLRHSPWPEAKLFNTDPNAPPAPPFVGSTPKELEESLRGPPGAQVQL